MTEFFKKTILATAILAMVACNSDDSPTEAPAPVIETSTTPTNAEITLTSIVINASIDFSQPDELLAYGVAWGTEPNPDISGNTTDESSSNANTFASKAQESRINFTSEITNLTPNETYYFRVYATTSEGTTYGEQIELNTLSLAGTTWDFLFIFSEEVSWNADVTFHEDGTAFYTEPASPGQFDETGSWILEGDQLTYDMDGDPETDSYVMTGTISGNQMEGTFTYAYMNVEENMQHLPWQAVLYED